MPSHLYLPDELHAIREDYLDAMREVLPSNYRDAPDEVVAHRLRETFESLSPAQQHAFSVMSLQNTGEFSLGDLTRGLGGALGGLTRQVPNLLRTVAPVAQMAAPLVGTMIGGPAGAMLGRTVGNFIGNASGRSQNQRTNPQAGLRGPQAPAMPQAPAAPGQNNIVAQGNNAVAQLMALLSNPQLIQALLANLLGNQGPQAGATVQQANGQNLNIPFGALMSTLSECAMRAAEESVANGGHESEDYLDHHYGRHMLLGSADPGEHADYVVGLLNENYAMPGYMSYSPQESYHDPLTEWFVAAGMIK